MLVHTCILTHCSCHGHRAGCLHPLHCVPDHLSGGLCSQLGGELVSTDVVPCRSLLQCLFCLCRIQRAEENENRCWYVLMLICSVVFYVGSLVGIVLLYVFFTEVRELLAKPSWSVLLNCLLPLLLPSFIPTLYPPPLPPSPLPCSQTVALSTSSSSALC